MGWNLTLGICKRFLSALKYPEQLRPNHPPLRWILGFSFPTAKWLGARLTTHPHQVLRLKMHGAIPSVPPLCLYGMQQRQLYILFCTWNGDHFFLCWSGSDTWDITESIILMLCQWKVHSGYTVTYFIVECDDALTLACLCFLLYVLQHRSLYLQTKLINESTSLLNIRWKLCSYIMLSRSQ
jgi:hypothetical protein